MSRCTWQFKNIKKVTKKLSERVKMTCVCVDDGVGWLLVRPGNDQYNLSAIESNTYIFVFNDMCLYIYMCV